MTSDMILSQEIENLAKGINKIAARDRQPDPDLVRIAEELDLTAQLAFALEQELAVFRALEDGRSARLTVEEAIGSVVGTIHQDGNVLKPDFGGRP